MGAPLQTPWSKRLGFHINSKLVSNLLYWRNMALYHDADAAIVIDGPEGSGKSVLGLQVGKFMDKDHHIDLATQVHFSSADVIKYARVLSPGKVIIYDEAGESLDVTEARGKKQKEMKQMFKEVRQRNLIFILVLPTYYDLQRWFALWRTRALIHTYWVPNISDKDDEKYFVRGSYRFYNERGKKILYVTDRIRKEYEYPTRWNQKDLSLFTGKFFKHYTVDEDAYRRKKREHSKSLQEDDSKPQKIDWRKETMRVLASLDRQRLLKIGWMQGAQTALGRKKTWMSQMLKQVTTIEGTMTAEQVKDTTTTKNKLGEMFG